ncbi:hypothetical protein ACYOEI_09900 [Singulisphaera rosea]
MFGASLALVILIGQVPPTPTSPDPSRLVVQLGATRYAERQAAASSLEGLGKRALPALRSAREVNDPEVRSRASALIAKIEGALLTHPTMIALNFQDRPLSEVLKSIGEQSGMRLAIYPETAPASRDARITLVDRSPLPFWKALDRLCEAGHLQYNFVGMQGSPNSREPVFPLFPGNGRPSCPVYDSGPFRANLISLNYQKNLTFGMGAQPVFPNRAGIGPIGDPVGSPLRGGPAVNEDFLAQIQFAAEPRLTISQSGALKILEAVDDRGQSLMVASSGGPLTQRYSGFFGMTAGSTLHVNAPLRRPEQPGKTIRRLRGSLPVTVATRKASPLVIPLTDAAGKSFRNEEVTLGVQEIKVNPTTRQTSIEISLRASQDAPAGVNPPPGFEVEPGMHRTEAQPQQIEVLDAQGRPIPWYHSNDAEGSRMTLTLAPHNQAAPSEIRYYTMAKAATEVRFEFTNVPMP